MAIGMDMDTGMDGHRRRRRNRLLSFSPRVWASPFSLSAIGRAVRCTVPAALAALPAVAAWAQAESGSAPPDTSPALTLGAVEVRSGGPGGALPARSVSTSVDIVGGEVLQDARVDHAWELMGHAPGVQVTPFRQGTDAGRFSFRGFNGEGRVNAIKLLIDGIPSNDNAGGMPFLDAVFPLDIEAVEVVRGTNDPRYGLHNIAGNVNVLTRTGGNEGRATVTAGSFGTRDVQVVKGIESGPWSQNYGLFWRTGDGWRDHAEGTQRALSGKWFYTDEGGRWRAGLTARAFRNEAQESGYLTREQAAAQPRWSPPWSASDRSTRETGQLGLHWDAELAERLSWTARAYASHYENQRWVRFSQAGVQQERGNDEDQRGLSGVLTWRPAVAWAHAFTLEGGVDAQWQDNAAQRWRTVERVRTSQFRDWDFGFRTQGAYVQAVVQPVPSLRIVPALRVDRLDGDFTDRLTGQRYGIHGYGTVRQPKLSVAWTAREGVTLYANAGRTFQVGTGIDAYRTQARDLGPSINDGWETGVRWQPAPGLEARVAAWRQRASGEVARVLGVDGLPDPGGLGNVGRTRRKGWDAQLNARLQGGWTGWVAYSHQVARIAVPDPSAPATAGREVENVPHYLVSAGVQVRATEVLRLSASVTAQGDYYLDRTNTQGRAGRYALLDLGATWQLTPAADVSLQVRNATDRRYVYAWYDSGSSGYSPGDGRSVSVSLGWRF
ncbi:iron complex outermembrane recepter protein [Paracidovorax konjaci]|uniref:Iron complex outermembrane recepter protein n=2 Tax=Paracidovorax konjaci TaxID=32040 RepID=A0A1I1Y852_9BURK|nr:iron complex outermembrane recepter protein [Paracidovorax konjaci]